MLLVIHCMLHGVCHMLSVARCILHAATWHALEAGMHTRARSVRAFVGMAVADEAVGRKASYALRTHRPVVSPAVHGVG